MMIKWVTIPKFCELTGYTPAAGSKIMALWSQFGHTKKAADK